MNHEKLMKVLVAPHISEKSTTASDKDNQVIFKVTNDASKLEIKKAVELLFKVEVDKVQTMNVRGKVKYLRQAGKRTNWKKAIVSLKAGQDIDFLGAE
jgi:large subunit ribosomal protein L23